MSRIYSKIPAAVIVLLAVFLSYHLVYAGKILPRVHIGPINVGGLSRAQALAQLAERADSLAKDGVVLNIQGDLQTIRLEDIGFKLQSGDTLDRAMAVGREGPWYRQLWARAKAPFSVTIVTAQVDVSQQSLEQEIGTVADIIEKPSRDIRFQIKDGRVTVLTDTKPGEVIDRKKVRDTVVVLLRNLGPLTAAVALQADPPRVDPSSVSSAKKAAEQMLKSPITLTYDDLSFVISREQIGLWIVSGYEGNKLVPRLDHDAISVYVTGIAEKVKISAQESKIKIQEGKVVEFVPPRAGAVLQEDETVKLIEVTLNQRRDGKAALSMILLPIKITKPQGQPIDGTRGIVELIGKATTPFTGSPKNRISNIKNGIRFLSGIMVAPGEEFSTLKSLGKVDNTTGYLPELVIKGKKTVPEFGGGLCQVSTTLFRSVLNAGLPVTARRNHSYRVPYYEKDGAGNYIGPGLDATIYEPDPDFRFRNDTGATILIYGYTVGDKATFEIYGTKDGRKSEVIGPKTVIETPAGPDIYEESDSLPKGTKKLMEKPHPGGSATASYKIIYSDGRLVEQEFKSYYRPWPARYLIGTGTNPTASNTTVQ